MNKPHQEINGFLVIDKPAGITSREAVDHVLKWFPQSRLGHAGTLDPAATGVLVIGIGSSATRFIEFVQDQEKTYVSTFRLGAVSTTDDGDGEITGNTQAVAPDEAQLRTTLNTFLGSISQTPPAFSAAKVQGVRAHTKARRGEEVILKPRIITVHEINLLRYQYPEVDLQIRCSKGTYIRSIARDLGEQLGIGGYVQQLRRTRIGQFTCEQALAWDASIDAARQALLPLSVAVQLLPRCEMSDDETLRLQQGQSLKGERTIPNGHVSLWHQSVFFGVGSYDAVKQLLRPEKILAY